MDWAFGLVAPILVEKGVAAGYGYKHASRSISFPASPWGDIEFVVSYLTATESYADLADFLAAGLSGSATIGPEKDFASPSVSMPLDERVTKISSEGVFQGNNSRS